MSGICGFFNRNGAPADAAILQRMLAAAPHRGRDGSDSWCAGSLALAHQHLNHLPAARHAVQPLRDEAGDLTLVFHGRIDNRPELAQQLEQPRVGGLLPTDAALVLCAYRRWGKLCSDRLVGDFAFVLWDGGQRQLLASRDPSGCIPFYYALFDDVFVFASELCQLLAHPRVPRRANEGMAAEFLSTGITSTSETLYRDILRLPPGQQLEVAAAHSRMTRHWDYLPRRLTRYRDPREYQEHFMHLFGRAVEDRLDCLGPPGISLSGGLDSTAVAGMAQSLLNRRGHGEYVQGFTLSATTNPDYDEGPYARLVAQKWGFPSTLVPVEPVKLPDWYAQTQASGDLLRFPNDIPTARLRLAAQQAGVATLFAGTGADIPLDGSRYGIADALAALEFSAAAAEFRAQWRGDGLRAAGRRLAQSLAWPLLPPALRVVAAQRRKFSYRSPFLSEQFSRQVDLHARHRADSTEARIASLASWRNWWAANNGADIYARELQEREDALHGLAGVHPFLDRRLLEFFLSVPSHHKRHNGRGKQMLVQSGLLPPAVAADRIQGDYSGPIRQALASAPVQASLGKLAIAQLGWVDQARVDEGVRRLQDSGGRQIWHEPLPHVYLWMVFSLEVWFQGAIMQADSAHTGIG